MARARGARTVLNLAPAGTVPASALPIAAVDATGAGNAFRGVLTASLDTGRDLPDALHRASCMADLPGPRRLF